MKPPRFLWYSANATGALPKHGSRELPSVLFSANGSADQPDKPKQTMDMASRRVVRGSRLLNKRYGRMCAVRNG